MKPHKKSCWRVLSASCVLLSTVEARVLLFKQPEGVSPLQGLQNVAAPVTSDPLDGCFEAGQSICVADPLETGKTFMFRPPATLMDLEVLYSFDKGLPVDESGHQNHLRDVNNLLSPIAAGPGVMGRGASASFDGQQMHLLPSNDALENSCSRNGLSIALWVYLLEDSMGSWRTIFSKGSSADELNPAMLLYPDERRLHLRLSSSAADSESTHGVLDSTGLLPLRRWTHLALTSTGGVMRLYVNGQLDGEAIVDASSTAGVPNLAGNKAPIRIGRDPWRAGFKGYIDDFRWYTRVMLPSEVRALTFPSLTGIGTDFVHLGCSECTFPEAVGKCKGNSHMCSLQELFAGGFHTARVMGWLPPVPEVWYYNEKGVDLFAGQKKLGLCCVS